MKDMHNLGIFDSLVKVWDSYPYGGCPGDYVVIGGEVVYWNDERRVWGDFGSDISSDKNQIVEGNLTIEKNLTIGGDTKGNTADFKKIVAETLNIKNPPYALKVHNHDDVYALSKHKHQLEDIIESGEGVVVPGKIENAKYADVAYDLDKNSPGNRRFISRLNDDTASGHLTLEKGATSKGLFEANNGLVVRKTEVVEPMLMSLLSEEFRDGIVEENEDVFIEELSIRAPGSASTLGELDNVTDEADSAVLGSLFVKGENWEAVPPVLSSLTDFDNMLMPVYHQVLGKWVFISVSSITGGVTPPVNLEMVLDTGLLDVNKLV